jgi:arabinofuranosyltransferase
MNSPSRITPRPLLFSAFISALACAAAFLAQLSGASLFAVVTLLFLHLPAYWFTRRKSPMAAKPTQGSNMIDEQAFGFILAATVLGTGLGFLSWLLYFGPGSLVRDILIQVCPLLGWAVVLAGYLLVIGSRALTADGESKHGYLLGAVVFSTAGFLFFFWLTAQVFSFTIDDAYITFRYSKNLAAGWGPTYNPGQPPVEGYTTFAWMLLMTVPHFIGVNVATFSKVVGVLLTSGTLALVWFLTYVLARAQATPARLFFGAFAAYLTGSLPITAIHAISGMETSLFTFLIAFMASMVLVGVLEGSRLLVWIPFIGLLVGLTRPEGNVISAGLIIVAWFFSRGSQRKRLACASLWMYLLPGGLYFLWRIHYYQLAFPLPFYMKVLHVGWLAGAGEVSSYLHYLLPTISVLAVVALLRYRREFLVVLLPAAFLLVFYLFPAHAMGFEWRFIYPATPFLYVVTALGAMVLFNLLSGQITNKLPWETLLIASLFAISLGNLDGLDKLISGKQNYGAGINNYKTFGTLLSEYNHEQQYTLAMGDAGTAPYYSDWQVIDLYGLNSRELAFGTRSIPDLLFNREPVDLIVLSVGANRNRISEEHAGANALYESAVTQGMARIATFPFGRTQFIWVVGYPDSDLAQYIRKNLSINVE